MVTDALLSALYSLLSAMVALLPKYEFPLTALSSVADLAPWVTLLNSYVPFAAPLKEILNFLIVAVPALFAYRCVLFVYNRIRG